MKHEEVAKRIASALGEDNVITAAHCATRLRLIVKDRDKIDQKALDNDPDLKGTFDNAGQFQIIVGPGDVNHVYDHYVRETGVQTATPEELKEIAAQNKAKQNPLLAVVKVLSDIFVPLIPAMAAGGLLMAINNLLTGENLFGPQSLVEMYPQIQGMAEMINLMASAPFAFLPILIGFTATKRFGGSEILGAVAGMMLVMPDLINGYNVAETMAAGEMTYWQVFGLSVAQAGYQGQVLPVIGVAFILATVEKYFRRHLKGAIDFTFTPMLAVLITGFVTFVVVGPALRVVSNGITDALVWMYSSFGLFGMGILGSVYSAIVVTGLHQSFPAIETQLLANIQQTGGTFIFPIAAMANIAQGAAAFAIFFLAKGNEKVRALSSSSGASAMLGITEPAIFGVNLKYKFPFFIALGAAGIAGLVLGAFHVLSVSLGPAGIIGFIAIPAGKWTGFFIGAAISFAIAFIVTYLYGKKYGDWQSENNEAQVIKDTSEVDENAVVITSPTSGVVKNLSVISDPVFASEAMGKGVAILSDNGEIYAPVNGEVTVVFPTKHAYGLRSEDGIELLIHIGVDTVSLNGAGFESEVQQGQLIQKGDLLGRFNRSIIQQADLDEHVMVLVTNSQEYQRVQVLKSGKTAVNDSILAVSK
jgi:PTS system sucrose-specific IIC component